MAVLTRVELGEKIGAGLPTLSKKGFQGCFIAPGGRFFNMHGYNSMSTHFKGEIVDCNPDGNQRYGVRSCKRDRKNIQYGLRGVLFWNYVQKLAARTFHINISRYLWGNSSFTIKTSTITKTVHESCSRGRGSQGFGRSFTHGKVSSPSS
ncbi:hypothetical protein TREMEDRAFT_65664 [Tremella mesenterica DSM 1558]|uniref:uncharacterized protein n=1 Tax=Tremella mesenterica (strain ATCC 24925 / CBS 8224 / DSM 1558 / NBRC 9311 / NRRL Y-6157 / RJB 2259-6 / UBC 559-6) TaxID=578456 RepID=UPI00032D10A4|nr:uncharacterized protein TREMEDRAFT_65664 [Tremella mesenterica DSM 1558]EIW66381.1 hypothetical protein TREMEDRAFT_65664 [Tremella mesenterica DSM 1558]